MGRISIKVVPDTSDFDRNKIKKELEAQVKNLDIDAAIGAKIKDARLASELKRAVKTAEAQVDDAEVGVEVDSTKAVVQMKQAVNRIKTEAKKHTPRVKFDADTEKAVAKANKAIALMENRAARAKPTVDLDADAVKARLAISEALASAQAMANRSKITYGIVPDRTRAAVELESAVETLKHLIGPRDQIRLNMGVYAMGAVDDAKKSMQGIQTMADANAVKVKMQVNTVRAATDFHKTLGDMKALAAATHLDVGLTINSERSITKAKEAINRVKAVAHASEAKMPFAVEVDQVELRHSMAVARTQIETFLAAEKRKLIEIGVKISRRQEAALRADVEKLVVEAGQKRIQLGVDVDEVSLARVRGYLHTLTYNQREVARYRIKVVGAARAITEITGVRTAIAALDKRQKIASDNGVHGFYALLMALLPLAPAIAPIANATLGAAAGLAAMGAAGVTAGYGIYNEWKKGTALGVQYKSTVMDLKTQVDALARSMAAQAFPAFARVATDVKRNFGGLSSILQTAGLRLNGSLVAGVSGTLNLFQKLNPAITSFSTGLEHAMQTFNRWSTSASADSFVRYLLDAMPRVNHLLGSLSELVIRLVQAFTPIGNVVVAGVSALSDAINAIPVGVLETIGTLVGGLLLKSVAVKVFGSVFGLLATRLQTANVAMLRYVATQRIAGAGATVTGRSVAFMSSMIGGLSGVLTLAVTGGILLWMRSHQKAAEEVQKHQQAVDALTQTLEQDGGVVGRETTKWLLTSDAMKSATASAKDFGISQRTLQEAMQGNAQAVEKFNTALHGSAGQANIFQRSWGFAKGLLTSFTDGQDAAVDLGNAMGGLNGKARKLSETVQGQATDLYNAKKAQQADTKAKQAAALAARWAAVDTGNYSTALSTAGTSAKNAALLQTNYKNATDAEKKAIDSLNTSMSQMLDLYNSQSSDAYSVASAQLQVKAALKESKGSVDKYSKSGNAAGQAIFAWNEQLKQQRTDLINSTKKQLGNANATQKANDKYIKGLQALKDWARATYGAKSSVVSMIDGLIKNAKQVGINSEKVKGYTRDVKKVPKHSSTNFKTPGSAKAINQAQTMRNKVKNIPGYAKVQFDVSVRSAFANLDSLQQKIYSIKGTTVVVGVKYESSPDGSPVAHGGRTAFHPKMPLIGSVPTLTHSVEAPTFDPPLMASFEPRQLLPALDNLTVNVQAPSGMAEQASGGQTHIVENHAPINIAKVETADVGDFERQMHVRRRRSAAGLRGN